jgi:hypothetical protein
LIAVAQSGCDITEWNKYIYRFWRLLAPRGEVNAGRLEGKLRI